MEASIQKPIQKFTAVFFERKELEFRDKFDQKSLPIVDYQDPNPDVHIMLWDP